MAAIQNSGSVIAAVAARQGRSINYMGTGPAELCPDAARPCGMSQEELDSFGVMSPEATPVTPVGLPVPVPAPFTAEPILMAYEWIDLPMEQAFRRLAPVLDGHPVAKSTSAIESTGGEANEGGDTLDSVGVHDDDMVEEEEEADLGGHGFGATAAAVGGHESTDLQSEAGDSEAEQDVCSVCSWVTDEGWPTYDYYKGSEDMVVAPDDSWAMTPESTASGEVTTPSEERGDSGDGISTPAEGSSLDDLLEWDATSAMQTASNLAEGEESSSSSEDETLASNSASFPSSELFMTENEEDASEEDSDSPSTSLTKLLTQEKYSGVGDVQNHLQELNRQITSKQRATSERLAQHRQKYGHALKEMLLSNRQVALTNKQVIAQIQDVQHSNLALRSAASRLVSQSHMLRKDLEALKANISIAGEFAKRALTSPALLDESWEMQVLRAMDESKKLETLGHEHDQMRLPQVHDVAMLFLDGAPLATSEDMLKMLAADVAYLDKKTADSEAQLAAKFREKTASLKHAHEELVAEQSRLKAQYSKVKDMNSKLQSAVQHLNTAKEELEQHTEALRRFTSQMGKPKATAASVHAAKPQVMATGRHKGIALLQSNDSGDSEESGKGIDTGAVGGSSLPEVNHLKASKEFKAVQANIESLQAKFATMSRQHVADIAKARAKYEKQLSSEHHKLIVLKKENTALARKIEAARGRNVDLRAQAKRFNVKNQVLVSQLQGIRANLSTADEWVQLSLDKSKAMMEEPEMEVLSQLDHEDAKAQAKEAHELRLNSIGSALLQEDDLVLEQPALEQDDHSANVFDKLDKAIAKMREEQRSNAESLQRAFEEQHSENLGRGKKLLAEQKNLKHKLSSEEALEQRLTAALKRLSEGHNTLRHQLHSVKHFSQMLSESGTQGG